MLLIGKNEMIGQSWMPPLDQVLKRHDLNTANLAYARWLGGRKGIEEITTEWNRVVIGRQAYLARSVSPVQKLLSRGRQVYGFRTKKRSKCNEGLPADKK